MNRLRAVLAVVALAVAGGWAVSVMVSVGMRSLHTQLPTTPLGAPLLTRPPAQVPAGQAFTRPAGRPVAHHVTPQLPALLGLPAGLPGAPTVLVPAPAAAGTPAAPALLVAAPAAGSGVTVVGPARTPRVKLAGRGAATTGTASLVTTPTGLGSLFLAAIASPQPANSAGPAPHTAHVTARSAGRPHHAAPHRARPARRHAGRAVRRRAHGDPVGSPGRREDVAAHG